MIISAKYASVCPCCSARIQPGTKVEWSKGSKAMHVGCAAKPGAKSVASAAPRTSGRRAPMGSGHGSAVRMSGYSSYCTDNASCGCYDCQ